MVTSGKVPEVETALEQPEALDADILVKNKMLVPSISGLGLGEVEEAMEVTPSEVLPTPAD